jgi:hypothetical protein
MIYECFCRCLSDIVILMYGFEQHKFYKHNSCKGTFIYIYIYIYIYIFMCVCVFNSYFSINTTNCVPLKFYVIPLSVQLPIFFFILYYFLLCPLYPHFLNLIFPLLFPFINNPHSLFRNTIFNFLLSFRFLCFVWV